VPGLVGWTGPEYTQEPRNLADFRRSGVIFPGVSPRIGDGCDSCDLCRAFPPARRVRSFVSRAPCAAWPFPAQSARAGAVGASR